MFQDFTAENGVLLSASSLLEVPHGFTTRIGGVSEGVYGSLNLGELLGDDEGCVRENYRRVLEALGEERGVSLHQVHGCTVLSVTGKDARDIYDEGLEADAVITGEAGLAIPVRVADCIPLLLHDPVQGVVGAVHAGWRGTVRDIAGETVRKMTAVYGSKPENIRAAIGPGIGACCFETGAEVPEAVYSVLGTEGARFVTPSTRDGHSYVDLKGVNRALLIRAGVPETQIDVSEECTMCLPEKYWSHRLAGGAAGKRGTQRAVIALKERLP